MTDVNCGLCKLPPGRYEMNAAEPQRPHCWQGEIWYGDGSTRVCPNWVKYLDELDEDQTR